MTFEEINKLLSDAFGDSVISSQNEAPSDPFVVVKSEKIKDISLFMRDNPNLKFDYLKCLSGMDLGENLGVVYHLYSMDFAHHFCIKTTVPKDNPYLPSVERVWKTADWHEREAFDLYGMVFEGHHNMIRILCPYDWEGYPLRKDYETPEYYHGMRVPY